MLNLFINILLPFALNVIRAYQYTPSNKHDGKLLNAVKTSAHYLACQDTNTLNFGQSAVLESAKSLQYGEGGI